MSKIQILFFYWEKGVIKQSNTTLILQMEITCVLVQKLKECQKHKDIHEK